MAGDDDDAQAVPDALLDEVEQGKIDCVRDMAYCLAELKAGRWPK